MPGEHMETQKRHHYLQNQWKKYPQMETPALSVQGFLIKFSEISMGKKNPKSPEFLLAGRFFRKNEKFFIESMGESIEILFQKPDELVSLLVDGDQVCVDSNWGRVNVQAQGFESMPTGLWVSNIHLLAPALSPLQILNQTIKRGKQWQHFLWLIRKCFQILEFTEVKTPTLVPSPGTEPYLDHFTTEFHQKNYYLPTSPELHLKKMLSRGWTQIFEIKSCFRNNELSQHHQPEFTMLEWYRAYTNLDHIEKDVRGLLNYLKLHWPDPVSNFDFLTTATVADLFRVHCEFELTPTTTTLDLATLSQRLDIQTSATDTFDDIFFRIFLEKIEPHLGIAGPQIIKNYPPSQAALARITGDGWAARFELYWKGLEIANAFDELNDPDEQRRRCRSDNELRKKLDRPPVPLDEEFLHALDCGLPPSAGIALGIDRLFMALVNESDISKTREFYLK